MAAEVPVTIRLKGAEDVINGFKNIQSAMVSAFSIGIVSSFAKKGLEEYSKLRSASNSLAESLGYQSEGLIKLAGAYSKASKYTDDQIIKGEALLSTYTKNENQIKQLLPSLLNLAARTGDINTAARLLGMSFEKGSPILSKYGINVIGLAGSQERLNSICNKTTAALGNQAKAEYEAMNPLDKMKKNFDDISRSLGAAINPEVEKFAKILSDNQGNLEHFAKFIGDNIDIIALTAIATGIAAAAPIIVGQMRVIATGLQTQPWYALATAIGIATIALSDWIEKQADEKIAKASQASLDMAKQSRQYAELNAESLKNQLKSKEKTIALFTQEGKTLSMTREEAEKLLKVYEREIVIFGNYEKSLLGQPVKKPKTTGEEETESTIKEFEKAYDLGKKFADEARIENEKRAARTAEYNLKKFEDENNDKQKEIEKYNKELEDKNAERNKRLIREDARAAAEYKKGIEVLSTAEIKQLQKTESGRMALLKKQQRDELNLARKTGKDITALEREQAEERAALSKWENEQKIQGMINTADNVLGALGKIGEASKAQAETMKRIKEGEAIVAGASAAVKALDNPVPVLKWIDFAAVVASTIAQIAIIENAKFAYGGIVTGGTKGQDSVPAMLMPGEIVYNPAHPNPALASMITNNTTTTNNSEASNVHIGGTTIVVQGGTDKKALRAISDVSERAIITALRKAQNIGKVSATGLKVRI